jgi:hypothetical protein
MLFLALTRSPIFPIYIPLIAKPKPFYLSYKFKLKNVFRAQRKKITREIRKHLETNENENTTHQNLWATVKAILTEKFTVINAYTKKDLRSTT